MGLIKSANAPAAAAPFSMKDIEKQAAVLLTRAREQADRLLIAAQAEAERLRQAARTQGHAEGRAKGHAEGRAEGLKAGREQALADHRVRFTAAVEALTAAAAELNDSRLELAAEAHRDVINLAIAIARRATKKQAMADPSVAVANVVEALRLVVHASDIRIAVHPTQAAVLQDALPALKLQLPDLEHVEVIEDTAVAPGGCRVFTAHGHIDGELDAQIERIAADLLPAAGEVAA